MKNAFLFSVPHSGSRMLCSALTSHPDIFCPHGYFRKKPHRLVNPIEAMDELAEDLGPPMAIVGHVHCDDVNWTKMPGALPMILLTRESVGLEPMADLTVTYEELTNGADMDSIPEYIARYLCDFLEVKYHPMHSSVRKGDG